MKTVRLPLLSETEFRDKQIIPLAVLQGWTCYFTWRSDHSPRGWVDLVLIRPPRALFRELKRDTGRATPAQRECLARLQACGLDAAIWRPRDWATIVHTLSREGTG